MFLALLALSVLHQTIPQQEPAFDREFYIRIKSEATVKAVNKSLRGFGGVNSRYGASNDFLVQLNNASERGLAAEKLSKIPGVSILDADEEPVDMTSLKSLDRKLAHIHQADRLVPRDSKNSQSDDADYLESYRYFFMMHSNIKGTLDWSYMDRSRMQASQLPPMQIKHPADGSPLPLNAQSWQFIGPTNMVQINPINIDFGVGPINGRVNAVAVDPKVATTIYAGAAQGGLWKSVDGGGTWNWLSSKWTQLGVNCISIDPNNTKTIYVGLGDYKGQIDNSHGFMKTTDGGANWSYFEPSVFNKHGVAAILIDPTNSQTLIAGTADQATGCDLFISQKGAAGPWTSLKKGGAIHSGLKFNTIVSSIPDRGGVRFYATRGGMDLNLPNTEGRLIYSEDHGTTWKPFPNTKTYWPADYRSYSVAVSPNDPKSVYYYEVTEGNIFYSKDSGSTWKSFPTLPFTGGTNDTNNYGQTWYDYYVGVTSRPDVLTGNPKDVVFVGLIDLQETSDLGNSWVSNGGPTWLTPLTGSNFHSDQHSIAASKSAPNTSFISNDGGVYRMTYDTNAHKMSYDSLNANLQNTMFYKIAAHPTNPDYVMGGTQDNSSPIARGNLGNWNAVAFGDGGGCAINQDNPLISYATWEYNQFHRTTDGWKTWTSITPPLSNKEYPIFVPRVTLAPWDQNLMYTGTDYLWQWSEYTKAWNRLGRAALQYAGAISAMEFVKKNPNIVYAAVTTGHLAISVDGGNSFNEISIPSPSNAITAISANPDNPSDIIIAKGGTDPHGLLRCKDVTAANPLWEDIGGTPSSKNLLPNPPINCFVRDPEDPQNTWFVGMDSGIFQTSDAGKNWTNAGTALGLPPVMVEDLVLVPSTRFLYAGTYGRGMWRLYLPSGGADLASISTTPSSITSGNSATGTVKLTKPAGKTGTIVYLSSSGDLLSLPTSIAVKPGGLSATFPFTAPAVASLAKTTLVGKIGTTTQSCTVTIVPPVVQSITLTPSSVTSGISSSAKIVLNGTTPDAGMKITLTSSSTSVTVTPSVTVSGGQTVVSFPVGTLGVASQLKATITAKLGASSVSAVLTVLPASLIDISFDNSNAVGGSDSTVTGTLKFNGPTAPAGAVVRLTSSNPAAARPPNTMTVKLAGDHRTATFVLTHFPVPSSLATTVSATSGAITVTAGFTAQPFLVTSVTLNPPSVITGNSVNGRVDLNASPSDKTGSIVVALSADNAAATVPATVSVTPHASYGTFGIGTPGTGIVNIHATLNGQSSTALLTINGLGLTTLTLSPDTVSVGTGTQVTGTVSLGSPAPVGGAVITLSSSLTALANVPQSVTIPAGQTSTTFQVRYTTLLTAQTSVTITAGYSGKQLTATLTLKP